jgi:hypothetical protein
MNKKHHWTLWEGLLLIVAIVFVLFLHGAVPFLTTPAAQQQGMWAMGFSQSFANGPWYSIYAHDFGIPKPAAIAFGLAAVWPGSLLIRLGLYPADAYSAVAAFWLLVAFFSAYKLGRHFGASRSIALLGGITWLSMPIIWAHADYSMLSFGIGLLSFYFLAAIKLFWDTAETFNPRKTVVVLYFLATIISVFMDGYSFMMFTTGASLLFVCAAVFRPKIRSSLIKIALPIHIASFALAYMLFVAYIGKLNFDSSPLDFFRGFGLDLSFVVIPTQGVHWLPDILGLSINRTDETFFGDHSVWCTTFSLPIVLAGVAAWWLSRKKTKLASATLLVAMFGFYMALGPSLKLNSTKPTDLQINYPNQPSNFMPAEFALMPTGNAWVSEKLPGFNDMRAAYRWTALGVFALWMLLMISTTRAQKKDQAVWSTVLISLIALNLPHLPRALHEHLQAHTTFHHTDNDLISALKRQIKGGQIVAFVPWGNDFIVNYVAPRAGFRTFNIGGDKNLDIAQTQWPPSMLSLGRAMPSDAAVLRLLVNRDADVVLIPYFDTLQAAKEWPPQCRPDSPPASCPWQIKKSTAPLIEALKKSPDVDVVDGDSFVTIKLRDKK